MGNAMGDCQSCLEKWNKATPGVAVRRRKGVNGKAVPFALCSDCLADHEEATRERRARFFEERTNERNTLFD